MNKKRNRVALNMAKSNSSNKISRRKFLEISALATAGVLTNFNCHINADWRTGLDNENYYRINKDSIMEGVAVRGSEIIDTGRAEKFNYIGPRQSH
jgi:hypothetical protein